MALGQDHYFDNAVMEMMLEILSACIRCWENTGDEKSCRVG